MKTKYLFCVLTSLLLWTALTQSMPMVENSVKFALERCKQFLDLAVFIKPNALINNEEIKRTKKMCDHIVLIDSDVFFHDELKVEENEIEDYEDSSEEEMVENQIMKIPEADALIRKKVETTKSLKPKTKSEDNELPKEDFTFKVDEENCMVQLYPDPNFQGEPLELKNNLKNAYVTEIKSVRILGDCSWRFFDSPHFRGKHFTMHGLSDNNRDRAIKDLSEQLGWRVGSLKSIKKVSKKRMARLMRQRRHKRHHQKQLQHNKNTSSKKREF